MRAIELDTRVLDRPDAGRKEAQAVVAEALQRRHPEAAVVALRAFAWASREMFEYRDAELALDRALRIARRRHLLQRVADLHLTRAGLHMDRGRLSAAERDLRSARSIFGDGRSVELEFLQGRLEQAAGRLVAAASSYGRALVADPPPPVNIRLKVLNNLAGVEATLGRLDRAEDLFVEGKQVAFEVGPGPVGFLTHNLGWLALQRGRLPEAMRLYDEGDAGLRAAGWPLAELDLDRLEALLTLRLPTEAAELAERVVDSQRRPGNQLILAQALLKQAKALLLGESYEAALQPATEARELFRRQRRPGWAAVATAVTIQARLAADMADTSDLRRGQVAASTLEGAGFVNEALDANLVVGQIAVKVGRPEVARDALGHVAGVARGGLVHQRLKGRLAEALLAKNAGDLSGVRRAAERGLRDVEDYRATLASAELRALASGHGTVLAGLGLEAALATRRPATVLRWLELGRGRSLLGVPTRTQAPEITATLAQLRSLASQQTADGSTSLAALATVRTEQTRLERHVLRLGRAVGSDATADSAAVSATDIQSALGDRALVEFGVHEGRVVAVTASAKRLRLLPLALASEVEVEQDYLRSALQRLGRARDERAVTRARAAAESALSRLDDVLLGPLRRELDGATATVVVPSARLLSVPWAALPSLHEREVVVSPAAGLWLRAEQRAAAERLDRSVALVAGPRLSGAVEEVDALTELHPYATALTPPHSTVEAVLAAIDGVALAHLACHGHFRADNPTFSALDMADGPLTVHDLEQIDRLPQCLVLAACDSGLSEAYPGEELLGFLARLLAGGTATVIASVVPVPDVDTVPLMLALHRSLKAGTSPAAALAGARAEVVDSSAQGFLAATAFACFGSG